MRLKWLVFLFNTKFTIVFVHAFRRYSWQGKIDAFRKKYHLFLNMNQIQEIQQQQEFEEWFDSESRRVQEEEAQATAAATAASRDGKDRRGRGRGGHKRGSDRGGTKPVDERPKASLTSDRKGSEHRQGSELARGGAPSLRGRGRGARRAGPG